MRVFITNRTQADVDRCKELAALGWNNMTDSEKTEWYGTAVRGAYNYSDLNRVETAVAEISEFFDLGLTTKTDWGLWDDPVQAQMSRYISNAHAIKEKCGLSITLPAAMNGFTYEAANNIEKMLSAACNIIDLSDAWIKYSCDVSSYRVYTQVDDHEKIGTTGSGKTGLVYVEDTIVWLLADTEQKFSDSKGFYCTGHCHIETAVGSYAASDDGCESRKITSITKINDYTYSFEYTVVGYATYEEIPVYAQGSTNYGVVAVTTGSLPEGELIEGSIAEGYCVVYLDGSYYYYVLKSQSTATMPAILGVAILGRTILGVYDTAEKLATPVIRLVTEDGTQLATPSIWLETVSDEETLQLSTPTIWFETVTDEEEQLATPEIYLETIEDTEKEDPVVTQLATPTIYLETVDDETVTLDAPTVSLNGSVLSWSAVEGAEAYLVGYLDSSGEMVLLTTVEGETEVDLAEIMASASAGEYEMVVQASTSDGVLSDYSNTATYAVSEVVVTITAWLASNTLYWDAVDGATRYEITCATGAVETQDTSINLATSFAEVLTSGEEYEVTIAAYGEDGTHLGDSPAVAWKYLASPVCLELNGVLKWAAVDGAASYKLVCTVVADGFETMNLVPDYTSTTYSLISNYNTSQYAEGTTVSVYVIATDGTYSSEPSNTVVYEVQA